MNGKVFCGNKKCNKNCAKNVSHVPKNTLCATEFKWKPDKNGECKEYVPLQRLDGE